jgi:hypothetical protein
MSQRDPKPSTPTPKPRETGKAAPRDPSLIVRTGLRAGPYEFL